MRFAFRSPSRRPRRVPGALLHRLVALLLGGACAPASRGTPASQPPGALPPGDSAFAAVQARGADPRGMGVDQWTSVHRFDALPDGGRIELQRAADDTAGVTQVRHHLRTIATAFTGGDFTTPAFVHMRTVPGTDVMTARRTALAYAYRDLPRGGELRITTRDPEALRAVHAFVAFQRQDHRSGGAGQPGHGHP